MIALAIGLSLLNLAFLGLAAAASRNTYKRIRAMRLVQDKLVAVVAGGEDLKLLTAAAPSKEPEPKLDIATFRDGLGHLAWSDRADMVANFLRANPDLDWNEAKSFTPLLSGHQRDWFAKLFWDLRHSDLAKK